MTRLPYFPPEAEVIETRQEEAFLIDSQVGKANYGYSDNTMDEL